MLTFFRRIRKRLLDGGRASRYMLYAVGEIALVVIGILIALQINNWNEWRKDRKLEKSYLIEIQENLNRDHEELSRIISESTNILTAIDSCILMLNEGKSGHYLDSLYKVALQPDRSFFGIEGGYQSMVSEGKLKIISDEALRSDIVNLYEHHYDRLEYVGSDLMDRIFLRVSQENVKFYDFYNARFRVELSHIRGDVQGWLDHLRDPRAHYINECIEVKEAISRLLQKIRQNLDPTIIPTEE